MWSATSKPARSGNSPRTLASMVIFIAADHRGFQLKEYLKRFLSDQGYPVEDLGNRVLDEEDDYPSFAKAVADKVSHDFDTTRGILICGSGVGMSVVANKYPHVRAALVSTPNEAFDSRNDDDTNVLCLSSSYVEPEAAKKILMTWLQAPFSEQARHRRRLLEITQVEEELARKARRGDGEEDEEEPDPNGGALYDPGHSRS